MILQLKDLALQNDIILNKSLTNMSPSNMYEILFDSEAFDKVLDTVLGELTKQAQSNFDAYVKNMWGYIQNVNESEFINFNRNFKDQIIIPSEYSFIYGVKVSNTIIHLKTGAINLQDEDLLIFKTEDFVCDESKATDRIALVGSISSIKYDIPPVKKSMI